jgi:hypothetical protein
MGAWTSRSASAGTEEFLNDNLQPFEVHGACARKRQAPHVTDYRLKASQSVMGQLTVDERRRIFAAREQRRQAAFVLPEVSSIGCETERGRVRRIRDLVRIALIVTLLAGGSVVWRVVEFHRPVSLLEAVLPRA